MTPLKRSGPTNSMNRGRNILLPFLHCCSNSSTEMTLYSQTDGQSYYRFWRLRSSQFPLLAHFPVVYRHLSSLIRFRSLAYFPPVTIDRRQVNNETSKHLPKAVHALVFSASRLT